MAELTRDVAAVTGGGSGIGRAIAEGLARAGAAVCILDMDKAGADETARLIAASGGRGVAIACDVSDEDSVVAAERAAADTFGPASVLVNNAGILRARPLDQLTLAEWNSSLAVNLTGYFLCARAFGRAMCTRGNGSIVHVGSIASSFAQTRGGAYSATKAGICGLSSTIAAEWGPFGVRSNVVHPGMIRTALSAPFYADPELARRREATVASRRTGVPEDVAQVVCFLASEQSGYVNGAELTVDGGFSRMAIDLVPRPGYEPR